MGTGGRGRKAGEGDYIQAEESADGKNVFEIPVEALDKGIDCAAYSKKKETWYDRTLVVRASSLPMEAYKEGNMKTVESLGLEDGTYTVEVKLNQFIQEFVHTFTTRVTFAPIATPSRRRKPAIDF